MPTSNNWLNPFQRSFNDIKSTLISKLRARVPEMSDYSEGNIFILIISIFSAIAEVIHFYIDNMAREAFYQLLEGILLYINMLSWWIII